MKIITTISSVFSLLAVPAGLTFNSAETEGALTYWDPVPYLFVAKSEDCLLTATVLSLPAQRRSVSFNSGYGSADLSVELSNGIITKVGQKTDTKVPETITAIAGLAKAISPAGVLAAPGRPLKPPAPTTCKPSGALFPIIDGKPMTDSQISFQNL